MAIIKRAGQRGLNESTLKIKIITLIRIEAYYDATNALACPIPCNLCIVLAADLQARVNLVGHVLVGPCTPVLASLRHCAWDIVVLDIIRTLNDIDVQAGADMPGDVAVERPDAGIVGEELHHNERWGSILLGLLEDLRVTAIGVTWIGDGAVPGAETFRKDLVYFLLVSFTLLGREIPTIMSVQVHGMSNEGEVIVDD